MKVLLDLTEYQGNLFKGGTLRDLVASIQEQLGEDRIIAHISVDARPLSADDWESQVESLPEAVIELTSSDKSEYIRDRLASAEHYICQIGEDLKQTQDLVSDGLTDAGHNLLSSTVESLLNFSEWYLSLLELNPEKVQTELVSFRGIMTVLNGAIADIIKLLEENDWIQLEAAIEKRLRPCIIDVTELCEETANSLSGR